jgi:hypothetical protein
LENFVAFVAFGTPMDHVIAISLPIPVPPAERLVRLGTAEAWRHIRKIVFVLVSLVAVHRTQVQLKVSLLGVGVD